MFSKFAGSEQVALIKKQNPCRDSSNCIKATVLWNVSKPRQ